MGLGGNSKVMKYHIFSPIAPYIVLVSNIGASLGTVRGSLGYFIRRKCYTNNYHVINYTNMSSIFNSIFQNPGYYFGGEFSIRHCKKGRTISVKCKKNKFWMDSALKFYRAVIMVKVLEWNWITWLFIYV